MKLFKSLGFALVFAVAVSFGATVPVAHASPEVANIAQLQEQIRALLAQIQALQNGGSGKPDISTGKTYYCPAVDDISIYPLTRGMRDGEVRGRAISELQKFLASYFGLDQEEIVTGYFGSITQGYVTRFQKENNVKATGTVGELTLKAIDKRCGGGTSSTTSFSATPTSGMAPLSVRFTSPYYSTHDASEPQHYVKFGDGSEESGRITCIKSTGTDLGNFRCLQWGVDHTYGVAGTYTAKLVRLFNSIVDGQITGKTETVLNTITITVGGTSSQSFSATPTSGTAPLTVTFNIPVGSAGGDYFNFGDLSAMCLPGVAQTESECTAPINTPFTHTYTKPGTYKVMHSRSLPSTILGTATITVGESNSYLTEQVKCVFKGATTEQRCYAAVPVGSGGEYGCSGVGSCTMTVGGQKGKIIDWKSTCGGHATTKVDGESEYANFSCATTSGSSIKVTSPNGGELVPFVTSYNLSAFPIRISQKGISSANIGLYKNDQWYGWIAQNVDISGANEYTYKWYPNPDSRFYSGLDTLGKVFKIYVTGHKADGTGYIDDKSDAPFGFIDLSSSSSSQSFSATPTSGAAPLSVSFYAGEIGDGGTLSTLKIDFGDGVVSPSASLWTGICNSSIGSSCVSIVHNYTIPGTYTAKLIRPMHDVCIGFVCTMYAETVLAIKSFTVSQPTTAPTPTPTPTGFFNTPTPCIPGLGKSTTDPNNAVICDQTISWTSTNATDVKVIITGAFPYNTTYFPTGYAIRNGANSSFAFWVTSGTYTVTLYSGTTVLDTRSFTVSLSASPTVKTITCAPNFLVSGRVFGTDIYTDDSDVCSAALHAGVVATSGGIVNYQLKPGQGSYQSQIRNGIKSQSWGSWTGSFSFTSPKVYGVNNTFYCPTNFTIQSVRVYGTDIYTDDSDMCTSALHAGVITRSGGVVTYQLKPGQSSYTASTRNEIQSKSWGSWTGSFSFVPTSVGVADQAKLDQIGSSISALQKFLDSLKQ